MNGENWEISQVTTEIMDEGNGPGRSLFIDSSNTIHLAWYSANIGSGETEIYYGKDITHDTAVTNVTSAKTVVCQGYCANINVTVENQGEVAESFNVTTYANTTLIETIEVTLPSGNFTTITFRWNTTDFAKGNYTISAYAEPVPGETDTADNNFTDGWIIVAMVGDITGQTGGLTVRWILETLQQ